MRLKEGTVNDSAWPRSLRGSAQLDPFFFFKPDFKAILQSDILASSEVTNERVWVCWGSFWYYYEPLMDFSPSQLLFFFFGYSNHPISCLWDTLQISLQGLDSFLTCHEGIRVCFQSFLEAGGQDRCWQSGARYTQAQIQYPILPICGPVPSLSKPRFMHLLNGINNSDHLQLVMVNDIIHIKPLTQTQGFAHTSG